MNSFWTGFEKQAKKLTTAERNALPDSAFAEPSKRKYPMEDANHAAAAASRVSHFGSPSEKAAVKSKEHRDFPNMGKE